MFSKISLKNKLIIPNILVVILLGIFLFNVYNISSYVKNRLVSMNEEEMVVDTQVQNITITLEQIKNRFLKDSLTQEKKNIDFQEITEKFDQINRTIEQLSKNRYMQTEKIQHVIKNLQKRVSAFKDILINVPNDVAESYEEGIYSIVALNSINEKMNLELIKLQKITKTLLNDKIIFIKEKISSNIKQVLAIAVLIVFIISVSSHFLHSQIMNSIFAIKDINRSFLMYVQNKKIDINRVKSFPNNEVGEILRDIDHTMHLVQKLIEKERELTQKTATALKENIELNKEIEATQKEIIFTMGSIGESRSKETGNHVKRVAEYSYILAKLYGLSEEEACLIKEASPMHDIGKVAIPDSILNKPSKLTKEEFEIMKTHAQLGYEMLKHSKRPILKTAAIIAREHHEKYNGTGYPRGLKEDEIHIYGAITALADVFDALGSNRCYKKAWPLEKIIDLIIKETGEHFHPVLANLFLSNLDKFLEVRDRFEDIYDSTKDKQPQKVS